MVIGEYFDVCVIFLINWNIILCRVCLVFLEMLCFVLFEIVNLKKNCLFVYVGVFVWFELWKGFNVIGVLMMYVKFVNV